MKNYFSPFLLILLLTLAACKKPKDTAGNDIHTSLASNIALDNNVYDSVTGNTAINHNGIFTEDRHGNANHAMLFSRSDSSQLDFGVDTLTSFPDNIFTISCWIMVRDTTQTICIISKRTPVGPWEYSIDNHFSHNAMVMDNWVSNGSTSIYGIDPLKAAIPMRLNTWMHVAYVADGAKLQVYVNGTLASGTDNYNSPLHFGVTTAHLFIGNGGGYNKNYFFDGKIDDIRIYRRALDAKTIQYLSSI